MNNIDEIIDMLSDLNSEEIQQKGLFLAKNVKNIKVFFQPRLCENAKSTWKNCASVICERSDAVLDIYLTEMLFWLKNLDDPGALLILDRLNNFSPSVSVIRGLKKVKRMALAIENKVWYDNLCKVVLS